MECSVKYIRETSSLGEEVGCLKPALCFRGRKVAHAVINDELRIRAVEIPLITYDKAAPVLYHGQPYATKAYADRVTRTAERNHKPVTQRALIFLTRSETVAEDTELPPDEPTAADMPQALLKECVSFQAAGEGSDANGSSGVQQTWPSITEFPTVLVSVPSIGSNSTITPKLDPTKISVNSKCPKTFKRAEAKPDGNLVRQLATEFKIEPQPLRVLLRKAGLRAPYTDLDAMRKAIKK